MNLSSWSHRIITLKKNIQILNFHIIFKFLLINKLLLLNADSIIYLFIFLLNYLFDLLLIKL
jgi:hypothetical protein